MDVCESYSGLWDIKFNPEKVKLSALGLKITSFVTFI